MDKTCPCIKPIQLHNLKIAITTHLRSLEISNNGCQQHLNIMTRNFYPGVIIFHDAMSSLSFRLECPDKQRAFNQSGVPRGACQLK